MIERTSQNSHSENRQAIPRIIHQIWYQGEALLPEKYRGFRGTWKKNHPDWEFILWDEKNMREFIHREYPWFASLFDGYPMDIQRIDSVRYFILNTFGGFYIDMDVESIRPIDELLKGYDLILSRTVGYNNAIIGCVSNHPLWQEIFANLRACYERPPSRLFEFHKRSSAYYETVSTGPLFFSRTVQEGRFDQRHTTRVCPGSLFEPDFPREEEGRIIRSSDFSEAYARHYGDLKWLPKVHRFLSTISAQVFKIYWLIVSGRAR